MTLCARCGADIHDIGQLCSRCTGRLRRQLLDAPDLLAELTFTALRQSKTGDGTGGSASVPWNERARQAQAAIRGALSAWCVRMCGRTGQALPERPARWLADEVPMIRLQPYAAAMAADIDTVMRAGWRAIDRPEDRWYAGPCGADMLAPEGIVECGWTLWARLDQVQIVCPQCQTSWRVDARREWLMAAADDVWETAPNIASALTIMLRTRVSPATIRYWASIGHLEPVGERGTAKLYRVGDVIELVHRRDTGRQLTDDPESEVKSEIESEPAPSDTPDPPRELTTA